MKKKKNLWVIIYAAAAYFVGVGLHRLALAEYPPWLAAHQLSHQERYGEIDHNPPGLYEAVGGWLWVPGLYLISTIACLVASIVIYWMTGGAATKAAQKWLRSLIIIALLGLIGLVQ